MTYLSNMFFCFLSHYGWFGFKVSKKGLYKQFKKKFDIDICIIEQKIQCWVRIRWKKCKYAHSKSNRRKTFAHSNKSQKLNFSVTFLLIKFFAWVFLQLFPWIQDLHHIMRFLYPYCLFEIFFSSYYHFLQSLNANADETAQ